MKKVFLHGELGKRFGREWQLNVNSPNEAVQALFSNNPNIEIYLNKKHQEGVYYGIKKAGESDFAQKEDYPLITKKDLHVFPIPHGSGGFLGSLVMMAITTAASIYISKKISEAMERDDSTLQAQTQSYIFNGTQNRYQQGAGVPLGYGTMKVGANVVSSCNINYDFNSESSKIYSFNQGLYSLVPEYDKNYVTDLGPLMSSFILNSFDGTSKYRFVDPAFQYLSEQSAGTTFGTTDGIYGGFEATEKQKDRITSVEKKGNSIGGYFYYEYNFAKGVDKQFLGNFSELGNWYPNLLGMSTAQADALLLTAEARRFAVSESNALRSAYVCLQSKPVDENYQGSKAFYPISFIGPDDYPSYLNGTPNKPGAQNGYTPTHVGQRWIGTKKSKGVGWYKLESASVIKSIDLVGEGEVDGFADKNGEKLDFDRNYKTDSSEIDNVRNEKDDYLQAVFLDDTPVKEINHQFSPVGGLDTYNINEFDIDVGLTEDGSMGSDNQQLLEPQYLFTANTREINTQLFGPRSINQQDYAAILPSNEFIEGQIYEEGEYVVYQDSTYIVEKSFNEEFSVSGNYYFIEEGDEGSPGSSESIVYFGDPNNATFYSATQNINEYQVFSGEYVDFGNNNPADDVFYIEDDKVRCEKSDGSMRYCVMGSDADKFLGTHDLSIDYSNKKGHLLFQEQRVGGPNTNSNIYLITGDNNEVGAELDQIAVGLTVMGPERFKDYSKDPMYLFLNYNDIEELNTNGEYEIKESTINETDGTVTESIVDTIIFPTDVVKEEVDITPGEVLDLAENLWNQIFIKSPKLVLDKDGNNVTNELGIFDVLSSSSIDDLIIKRFSEESYISHTIINPLVEQAYVTLQVDELGYIYEGDEVNVSYQIGKLWTVFLGIIGLYHLLRLKAKGTLAVGAAGISKGASAATSLTVGPAGVAANALLAGLAGGVAAEAGAQAGFGTALIASLATLVLAFVLAGHRFDIGTKIENSGEIWPNRARFRIKYGNEGEGLYSTDVYIFGIATSTYRKDVKIYLPPNPSQKDRVIKVYKLNRERNFVKEGEQAARYKEILSLASVTEITPAILNYAGSVVIGTRVNAKDVPDVPKRNYHLRLKKVMIPSNYNPNTRVYTGNWNGAFNPELAWTNNPAWCLYDLISNKKFGVGKFGIKQENIDRWTLYKIAKYCDELVLTGYSPKYKKRKLVKTSSRRFKSEEEIDAQQFILELNHVGKQLAIFHEDGSYESIRILDSIRSTKEILLDYEPRSDSFQAAVSVDYPILEPRYTMNAFIMNQDNAFKLINEFAAIFRSYGYWSGGSINFFQDEKKEAVMLFANNNISEEGFSYSSTPKTSRTNSCNIKYIDRYNMYRPKIEHAEDREAISENNYVEQMIDGFGVTSQAQAKRASEFIVKSANLETELISFTTNMAGSYLKPGDVIDVMDNKRTIGRFAGKVVDIDLHPRGMLAELTLDYPIHTFIDKNDKSTWKKIKLYQPTGNETIESLDSTLNVTDEKIDNMRVGQIGEYLVYDISQDNTKIKLYNNVYSFVTGRYNWYEALRDAKLRSGQLAIVEDSDSQTLMKSVLPTGEIAWLGGFNRELPAPEKIIWHNSSSCGDNAVEYESWADGYPRFADPLEVDELNGGDIISTDLPEDGFSISADAVERYGNFIATSGSSDLDIHGGWIHMSGRIATGYMLEEVNVEGFEKIENSQGTTFAMEDVSNFAQTQQYKVINITEETNGVFRVNGLQYNAEKFDNIEKNLSLRPPAGPVIFNDKSDYNQY